LAGRGRVLRTQEVRTWQGTQPEGTRRMEEGMRVRMEECPGRGARCLCPGAGSCLSLGRRSDRDRLTLRPPTRRATRPTQRLHPATQPTPTLPPRTPPTSRRPPTPRLIHMRMCSTTMRSTPMRSTASRCTSTAFASTIPALPAPRRSAPLTVRLCRPDTDTDMDSNNHNPRKNGPRRRPRGRRCVTASSEGSARRGCGAGMRAVE
jgi:hypothetical protein